MVFAIFLLVNILCNQLLLKPSVYSLNTLCMNVTGILKKLNDETILHENVK